MHRNLKWGIFIISIIGVISLVLLPNILAALGMPGLSKVYSLIPLEITSMEMQSVTIVGDTVYIDDDNVYISATPATIDRDSYVYFNITSKVYEGDADAVLGFNTSQVKIKSVELYNPKLKNRTYSYTCDTDHFNYTSNYAWCYEHIFIDNVSTDDFEVIFEHAYDRGNLTTQTIYWDDEYLDEWQDFSDSAGTVIHEFGGVDKWHYVKNIPIEANKSYLVRAFLVLEKEGFAPVDMTEKYWFAIKPSSETISEAIGNNHLYYLDPWINVTEGDNSLDFLDDGLQHYYKFDEGTGTLVSDEVDGTGNFTSCDRWTTDGIINDSSYFALCDEVTTSYDFSGYGDELTINAWVYNNGTFPTGSGFFQTLGDSAGSWYFPIIAGTNEPYFKYRKDAGSYADYLYFNATPANIWTMITLVINDSNVNAYQNGTYLGSVSWASVSFNSNNFRFFGGDSPLTKIDHGRLDEVGIWNRLLNQSEITDLYNLGNGVTYVQVIPPAEVVLNITDPTVENPESVTSYDNITLTFNVTADGIEVTTGISIINITIGEVESPVVNTTIPAFIDVIEYATWENDFEGWTDGGIDTLLSQAEANCGTWSMRVSDNSGDGYTEKALDFSGYDYMDVNFSLFITTGVDNGECLALTCDGNAITDWGSSGCTINQPGENAWYDALARIDSGDCDFETNPVIRIESGSSGSQEIYYFDCMNISSSSIESIEQQLEYIAGTGWQVNVTVPNFASGLKDLFINASYLSISTNDTETNAIDYGGADPCTCAGLNNNWEIDMSDYCNITTTCDLGTGTLSFTGAGVTRCNATVSTTNLGDPGATGRLEIDGSCRMTID